MLSYSILKLIYEKWIDFLSNNIGYLDAEEHFELGKKDLYPIGTRSISVERTIISIEILSILIQRASLSIEIMDISIKRDPISIQIMGIRIQRDPISIKIVSISIRKASL